MATERSMLSAADDYLIHQTPDVIRHAFTSDRRFYDRHFLTGHANSGELMFLGGVGVYPNLSVVDAFFTFSVTNKQITVRGSRELSADRMDTANIGPFSLTVIEGLKSFRITCAETDGVSFDLTWTNSARAFEEPPFFQRSFGRIMEQGLRFVQTGRWKGFITIEGKRHDVTPETWWGSRDRSWGVRSHGFEDEPAGISSQHKGPHSHFWIWSPMQFEHATVHFNVGETGDETRFQSSVRWMKAGDDDVIDLMNDAKHDLVFDPKTRTLKSGIVSFAASNGRRHSIKLQALRTTFLFAATGYAVTGSPAGAVDDWRHGKYMGRTWTSIKRFDLTDPQVFASIAIGAHTLCRLELDTGQVGFSDVENIAIGYPRYGL